MSQPSVHLPELGGSYRETAVQPGPALGPVCVLAHSVPTTTLRSSVCEYPHLTEAQKGQVLAQIGSRAGTNLGNLAAESMNFTATLHRSCGTMGKSSTVLNFNMLIPKTEAITPCPPLLSECGHLF